MSLYPSDVIFHRNNDYIMIINFIESCKSKDLIYRTPLRPGLLFHCNPKHAHFWFWLVINQRKVRLTYKKWQPVFDSQKRFPLLLRFYRAMSRALFCKWRRIWKVFQIYFSNLVLILPIKVIGFDVGHVNGCGVMIGLFGTGSFEQCDGNARFDQ